MGLYYTYVVLGIRHGHCARLPDRIKKYSIFGSVVIGGIWSLMYRYDTHPRVFSSDEKVRATASWPPSFLGKRVHRPRSLVWSILVTYSEYRQVDCERCRFIPGNEKRIFFPSFYSGLSILFFFFSFFLSTLITLRLIYWYFKNILLNYFI